MLLPTECYKDVLSFLSRNDLDIISLVNRQSASVVAKYFASDAKPSRHMHSWVVSKNPGVPYLYPNEVEEPMHQIFYNKDGNNMDTQKRFFSFKDFMDLNTQQSITVSTLIFKNLVCVDDIYIYLRKTFRFTDFHIIFDQVPIGVWWENDHNIEKSYIEYESVDYEIPSISSNADGPPLQRIYANIKPDLREYDLEDTDGHSIGFNDNYFVAGLLYHEFLASALHVRNDHSCTGPEKPITIFTTEQWEYDKAETYWFFDCLRGYFCTISSRETWTTRPIIFAVKDCGDAARELFVSGEVYSQTTNDIACWFFIQDPPVNYPKEVLKEYANFEWIFTIGQKWNEL